MMKKIIEEKGPKVTRVERVLKLINGLLLQELEEVKEKLDKKIIITKKIFSSVEKK